MSKPVMTPLLNGSGPGLRVVVAGGGELDIRGADDASQTLSGMTIGPDANGDCWKWNGGDFDQVQPT